MKKKILCLVLTLVMAVSLAACGGSGAQTVSVSGDSVTVDDLALRPDGEAGRLYENDGLKLLIPLEYDELLLTETLQDNEDGVLFAVSEKASVEAAGSAEAGAGWLFSIGRISEDQLHEMLCYDMSGAEVLARDDEGRYLMYYHPTDVRFFRESNEAMAADQELWTVLNEWAWTVRDTFLTENSELTSVTRGNTMLDMYLARAAYLEDVNYTVSTTEYGPKEGNGVYAAPYAEQLMSGNGVSYEEADISETPDGEYVVLSFPEDDVRFDFFLQEGKENYVRQVWSGDNQMLYKASFADGTSKASAVMQAWYDTLVADADMSKLGYTPDALLGTWAEKIAGRGTITIREGAEAGSYDVQIHWGSSASETYVWTMTAVPAGSNALRYEDGTLTILTLEEGKEETEDLQYENGTGLFSLNSTNELVWQDDIGHAGDNTVFVSVDLP